MLLCFIPKKLQNSCIISALKGKRRIGEFLCWKLALKELYEILSSQDGSYAVCQVYTNMFLVPLFHCRSEGS